MLRRKHRKVHNFFSTNKKELENGKIVTYKIKFIDSLRFMIILFQDVTIINAKAVNLVLHT